jgi:hypothetical protein
MTPLHLEPTRQLLVAYEAGEDLGTTSAEHARLGVLSARSRHPAAQYASYLVARAIGGTRATSGAPQYHVEAKGRRLQVHGRRAEGRDLNAIPVHFDRQRAGFDALVPVRFEHDFSVGEAWILPHAAVLQHARPEGLGWVLPVTGAWRGDARVARLALHV